MVRKSLYWVLVPPDQTGLIQRTLIECEKIISKLGMTFTTAFYSPYFHGDKFYDFYSDLRIRFDFANSFE